MWQDWGKPDPKFNLQVFIKGEFWFLRPWTLFLDLLLSNRMMVFSISALTPVESEGSPKLLNLGP